MTQTWTGIGPQGPYVATERWATREEPLPPKSPQQVERARIDAWKAEHVGNDPRLRRIAKVAETLVELDESTEAIHSPVQNTGQEIAEFDIEPPKDALTAKEIADLYYLRSPRCVTLAFYELLGHGLLENSENTGKYFQYRDGKRTGGLRVLRIDAHDQTSVIALLTERGEIVPSGVVTTTRIDMVRDLVKEGYDNPRVYAVYTGDGLICYGVTTDKQAYDKWYEHTAEVIPGFDVWTDYFKQVSKTVEGGLKPYKLSKETISSAYHSGPLPKA